MKFIFSLFIGLLMAVSSASAQSVVVNGVDSDGYIGVYDVNGSKYWWLCIEPNGSQEAGPTDGFIADQLGFSDGWDQQNVERQTLYSGSPAAQAALAKQISVMSYVLDTYLPISTLSTPGALQDYNEQSGFYGNDEAFYNSLNAVQNFLAEVYGKPAHTDFTNLADFVDRWIAANDTSAAGLARSDLFQDILDDVAAKDAANFFNTYTAQNSYFTLNTLQPTGNNTDPTDPNFNWQDALVIAIPVPEPGGALLIGCFGFMVMFRRWRNRMV